MQRWIIVPENTPEIIACCGKCGSGSRFECSNSFRINANGKELDVWLIYKCIVCNSTLNIEIFSRVKRNKVVISYENVEYSIEKSEHDGDTGKLEIVMDLKFPIRLDKLLSDGYGLPRSTIQHMIEGFKISCARQNISANMKVKDILVLEVDL